MSLSELFYAAQLLDWITRPGDHELLPGLREARKLLGYEKKKPNRWLRVRIHKAPPQLKIFPDCEDPASKFCSSELFPRAESSGDHP